jgi:hypothetical protein
VKIYHFCEGHVEMKSEQLVYIVANSFCYSRITAKLADTTIGIGEVDIAIVITITKTRKTKYNLCFQSEIFFLLLPTSIGNASFYPFGRKCMIFCLVWCPAQNKKAPLSFFH